MKPRITRLDTSVRLIAIALVMAVVLAFAPMAMARVDEFGGASYSTPYAPYTAGPVVDESEAYAPYSVGPHIPTTPPDEKPYAPYTAGPVVGESEPYAPYSAGPHIPTSPPAGR